MTEKKIIYLINIINNKYFKEDEGNEINNVINKNDICNEIDNINMRRN